MRSCLLPPRPSSKRLSPGEETPGFLYVWEVPVEVLKPLETFETLL